MKRSIFIVFAAFIILLLAWYFIASDLSLARLPLGEAKGDLSCATEQAVRVDGNSMEPVLATDSEITVLAGYYDCNAIQRGDIAVYRYSESRPAVVKFVTAVPGDRIALAEAEGGSALLINGDEIKNSQDEAYRFNAARANMLNLYITQYDGILPADTYLLLGNNPAGSYDSSQFGMVGKDGFVGKIK